MDYSRIARLRAEKEATRQKRRYSIRKMSTIGAVSALVGTVTFFEGTGVSADVSTETTTSAIAPISAPSTASTSSTASTASTSSTASTESGSVAATTAPTTAVVDSSVPTTTDTTAVASTQPTVNSEPSGQTAPASTSSSEMSVSATPAKDYSAYSATKFNSTGLSELATAIAQDAGLDINSLTDSQKTALNSIYVNNNAETGTQLTYQQFQEIADTVVAQDSRYAIPFFNAAAIKNMKAATTVDAQTGNVADLDVWDSWPVQNVKTGEIINWNGYQLVVAMMGVPNTNDNHLYLLYNDYADNNFDNWRNAGSIFGYGLKSTTQQWSGSATVNADGTIQLYYTNVDTTDHNSNNQMLATATLNLVIDNNQVVIKSVDNNKVLTPAGGDGYHYQSYAQWRSTFTGADNIAMRDPHVIEDDNGDRYLVFEASTGTQNYQGENQIYNWKNYGGDANYNVSSLFNILSNQDMRVRASISNAAIGILRLTGDVKTPSIAQYYTPLLSSVMVSDEIERPNVVKVGNQYYLFAASRLNHGSNNDAWNKANEVIGDNVIMLGYVSDNLTSGYKPLNGSGIVLTASVPADWRTASYSYYAVPVEGSSDTLLVTAYMTNRNEVAGKGNNSTWAPSFLIQILPDGTTRVLAKMTEQGDWIWSDSSESQSMVGTLETAHLPGEDDGRINWDVIGGYGLKPHTPYELVSNTPTTPKNEVPTGLNIPGQGGNTSDTPLIPENVSVVTASMLPKSGDTSSESASALGFAILLSMTAYVAYGGYKRKYYKG